MLAQLLDAYVEANRTSLLSRSGKFHVSDAGRCHLYRFWKRKSVEPTDLVPTRVLRVFEAGNIFHFWLQDILEKSGYLLAKEKEVEDEHRKGRIDAIVEVNGKKILYDFKTVHSRKFNYGLNDIHYCMQAFTYKTMLEDKIDKVIVAYISKDDLRIHEAVVDDVEDIAELVKTDWETLLDAWLRDKEPEPNPQVWECKECMYRSRCKPRTQEQPETVIVQDVELETLLEKRAELLDYAKELEEVEEKIKNSIKNLPQLSVIGRWKIEKKLVTRTVYDVPDDIKSQYKTTREYEKINIQEVTA